MTLASDVSTAVAAAVADLSDLLVQLKLLESYRVANGGAAFYAVTGVGASQTLRTISDAYAPCDVLLKSLIRG